MSIKPLLEVPSRPEETMVADFLAECVTRDPGARTSFSALDARHIAWCQANDYTPIPSRRLGKYIRASRRHVNGVTYILGIRLT